MTLTGLCSEINNWFVVDSSNKHFGVWEIEDGVLKSPPEMAVGRYYRIVGSAFNDGVHRFGEDYLTDEIFEGSICLMSVPVEVIDLLTAINDYEAEYGKPTPYQSESFGGYSYSKASGKSGGTATWKDVFASRLRRYRKV